MTLQALAHPEKRLFIHLLTRDISLIDAFLDLLDNSINAALKSIGIREGSADDYVKLLESERKPEHAIRIRFDDSRVEISDTCGGISAKDASEKVFVFGASDDSHMDDKLSVYGIGLKRAMFKLGNRIQMDSLHPDGGFALDLNVDNWRKQKQDRWSFEISEKEKSSKGGTRLLVTELYDSVRARLSSPAFASELRTRISRAYSFFISRVVSIELNGDNVAAEEVRISSNKGTVAFTADGVSVAIAAGLGIPNERDQYQTEYSGWNVYCNGRAVISFDRSPLTGWGVDGLLPTHQPKHRPFVGNVFFTSMDPERLPWTTTKLGVNTDNLIWQLALQKMADVARQVIKFLDTVYNSEGTTITRAELSDAIGKADVVKPAVQAQPSLFAPPPRKVVTTTSIQYVVERKILAQVKKAIGNSSMSNAEVGHYTFNYFVENEVSE